MQFQRGDAYILNRLRLILRGEAQGKKTKNRKQHILINLNHFCYQKKNETSGKKKSGQ